MKELTNKIIGCKKCRQEDDCGYIISNQKYDGGWFGKIATDLILFNATEYMKGNGDWEQSDTANLYFSMFRLQDNTGAYDDNILREEYEIKFCPYCGANLKEVRDYVRSLESEDE